jgi:hypothetical protein
MKILPKTCKIGNPLALCLLHWKDENRKNPVSVSSYCPLEHGRLILEYGRFNLGSVFTSRYGRWILYRIGPIIQYNKDVISALTREIGSSSPYIFPIVEPAGQCVEVLV